MFWDGGGTRMTAMSCFSSTKIYQGFVGVGSVFCPVLDTRFTQ